MKKANNQQAGPGTWKEKGLGMLKFYISGLIMISSHNNTIFINLLICADCEVVKYATLVAQPDFVIAASTVEISDFL